MQTPRRDWIRLPAWVGELQSQVSTAHVQEIQALTQIAVRKEPPSRIPDDPSPNRQAPFGAGAPSPNNNSLSPEQARMQEEYMKALFQGPPGGGPGPDQSAQQPGADDPMTQMLQSLMGNMSGDPGQGGAHNNPGGLPFSPDDLAQATGLPSWATGMMFGGGKAPPTPAQQQSQRMWKTLHVVVAVLCGVYMLFAVNRSTRTFGSDPPAPPTFQNPFMVFIMAQLLLQGTRILSAGQAEKKGIGLWFQMLKQLARDGAVVVFMLGCASWWKGNS
jgi:GET complex subunit GET2